MQPFYHSPFHLDIIKISSVSRTVYEGTHKLRSVFITNKASRVFFPRNKSLNLKNSFTDERLFIKSKRMCTRMLHFLKASLHKICLHIVSLSLSGCIILINMFWRRDHSYILIEFILLNSSLSISKCWFPLLACRNSSISCLYWSWICRLSSGML